MLCCGATAEGFTSRPITQVERGMVCVCVCGGGGPTDMPHTLPLPLLPAVLPFLPPVPAPGCGAVGPGPAAARLRQQQTTGELTKQTPAPAAAEQQTCGDIHRTHMGVYPDRQGRWA
jgi:hypothetical protein